MGFANQGVFANGGTPASVLSVQGASTSILVGVLCPAWAIKMIHVGVPLRAFCRQQRGRGARVPVARAAIAAFLQCYSEIKIGLFSSIRRPTLAMTCSIRARRQTAAAGPTP